LGKLTGAIVDHSSHADWRKKLNLFDLRSIKNEWPVVVHSENADEFQTPIVHHLGFAEEGKGRRIHAQFFPNSSACGGLVAL